MNFLSSRSKAASLVCAVFCTAFFSIPAEAEDLNVSAAISLQDAFLACKKLFERANPGSKVFFNFGASGTVAAQIEHGAVADVYAAASVDNMHNLIKKGLIKSSDVKCLAINSLVIAVPVKKDSGSGANSQVERVRDLLECRRVAIGDPQSVPAGRYAVQALSKARVYDEMKARHSLVFAESVRQVLTYVESGNVDAGLVYATDLRSSAKARAAMTVRSNFTDPIVYPIAMLKESKHGALAARFIKLVTSAEGQKLLQSQGFLSPSPSAPE